MSDFIVDILEPTVYYLNVSTSFIENINDIEIERSENFNLEIVNTEKILVSDLPDNIPISKIVGNLDASRINGLAAYINNNTSISVSNVLGLKAYLDNYEFDCGIPTDE